jgi:hypothetical protein
MTRTLTSVTVLQALTAGLSPTGPATAVVLVLLCPVVATTIVLSWHGLGGTNPGPAATQLLKLVELVLPRRLPRRARRPPRR